MSANISSLGWAGGWAGLGLLLGWLTRAQTGGSDNPAVSVYTKKKSDRACQPSTLDYHLTEPNLSNDPYLGVFEMPYIDLDISHFSIFRAPL